MSQVHIDESMISELQDVMGEDFSVLLETYLADSRDRLNGLQEAIISQETDELRKVAHSFKGSSGNIGAPCLYELCKSIEDLARSGTVEGCGDLFQQVVEEFKEVERLMQELM